MLNRNVVLAMCTAVLFFGESILFSQEQEVDVIAMKKVVATQEVVKAQSVQEEMCDEELAQEDERVNAATE